MNKIDYIILFNIINYVIETITYEYLRLADKTVKLL